MKSGGKKNASCTGVNSKHKMMSSASVQSNWKRMRLSSKKEECIKKKDKDIRVENNNERWSIGKSDLLDMGVNTLPDLDNIESENGSKKSNRCSAVGDGTCLEEDLKKANEFLICSKRSIQKKKHAIGNDVFSKLSDEIVLMIMQYLPRRTLFECAHVCQRWRWISYDESLWTRIDCSGRTLHSDSMYHIFTRNPRILRMAQAEVQSPLFKELASNADTLMAKVEYLDLSMAVISCEDLALLLSKCNEIRKLSLEHCVTDENVCKSVSNNKNLEVLNLSLCYELNEIGLTYIFDNCKKLSELNIQWTGLSQSAINVACSKMNPGIKHLNMAGFGRNMTDESVEILLKRCPNLIELDLSDCIMLSDTTVDNLMKYVPNLTGLSMNRCYKVSLTMYSRLVKKSSLKCFNLFGLLPERHLSLLELSCSPRIQLNRSKFSTIARPTVGIRRTSIWGLRVRD